MNLRVNTTTTTTTPVSTEIIMASKNNNNASSSSAKPAPPPAAATNPPQNESSNFYFNDYSKVKLTLTTKTGGYKVAIEYPFRPLHGDKIVNQTPGLHASFVNGPGLPVSPKIKFTPERYSLTLTDQTFGMKPAQEKWTRDFFTKMRERDDMYLTFLVQNSEEIWGDQKSRDFVSAKYRNIVQQGKIIDKAKGPERYADSIEFPVLTSGGKGNKVIAADVYNRRMDYNIQKKKDEFHTVQLKTHDDKFSIFNREYLGTCFVQLTFEDNGLNQHLGNFKAQLLAYEMKVRPVSERLPSTSVSSNDYDSTVHEEIDDEDQYASFIQGSIPPSFGDDVVASTKKFDNPKSPPPPPSASDSNDDDRAIGEKSGSKNESSSSQTSASKQQRSESSQDANDGNDDDDGMCHPHSVTLD